MPSDILSTIFNWVVTGLVVLMTFMLRKIFMFDTQIAVLERQLMEREKHLDQQIQDIKESVTRIETVLIKKK